MKILGLLPEPPFDPLSWSGSSAHFFTALADAGALHRAEPVALGPTAEAVEKLRCIAWPLDRWKARYHASTHRFESLSAMAGKLIGTDTIADSVLQIGAWFSSPSYTTLPCYSYHDGNAAMWYRHYGRGMLSQSLQRRHLDWERTVYEKMRGIFVMSQWLASSFMSDFDIPADKLHVVGAGINFDRLPDVPSRDYSQMHLIFVGRDFERKDGPTLLRAFQMARRLRPTIRLTIVGPDNGPELPGVTFAGYLSKSNPEQLATLQSLFEHATAVVLPSRYEPFGISLLEGMAYGLPCIAADRCAMPEIVQQGVTGLVFPPGNADALAEAICTLASDPAMAASMGEQGRQRVETHYTWNAVAARIAGVMDSTLRSSL